MSKINLRDKIACAVWRVWATIAMRIGQTDPDYPNDAWVDTRPRAKKISDTIESNLFHP